MENPYIPREMVERELSFELVNYSLYEHLQKVNDQPSLDYRLKELVTRQVSLVKHLEQLCQTRGTLPTNFPSQFTSTNHPPLILEELLNRENELLQEYIGYQRYFLSQEPIVKEIITIKEEQIHQLSQLSNVLSDLRQEETAGQDYYLEVGYRLEKVVADLTFPTVVTFDDQGTMYVVEAGYAYGAEPGEGRILRIGSNGEKEVVAGGFAGPVTGLAWHAGNFYVAEGGFGKKGPGCGRIIKVTPAGGRQVIVSNLRTCGDHFTGDVKVGPDRKLYFTVGTATNTAVVGPDNDSWLKDNPSFHDVPARDYVLRGENFVSKNPLKEAEEEVVETGAFKPFGVKSNKGEVIQGDLYANGVVYQSNLDGSQLRIYADGLRNPFGLGFSPFNKKLYLTDNGADVRGSRPIKQDWDNFWEIKQNGWYGWPDFFSGLPATHPRFHEEGKPKPGFLLKRHPKLAGQPVVRFEPHTSSNKFSFSTNRQFGFVKEVFVAQLGGMKGESGLKVVRVNLGTGQIRDFYRNNKGLEIKVAPIRPVAATFNPKGDELYIVDFGLMGPREKSAGTGSVWRIVKG